MSETSASVRCRSCGESHSEGIVSSNEVQACPNCASTNQHVMISISDNFQIYDQVEAILEDASLPSKTKRKKTRVEIITGSEWSVSRQKVVNKERLIDRKNDRYRELVTDPETGEVIHECEEPLSQHTGHGDAKGR